MREDYQPAPLVKVTLTGSLAEEFGAEHKARGRSVTDLCLNIAANHPRFKVALYAASDEGIGFRVTKDGDALTAEELHYPAAGSEIIISPVPMGSGNVGRILLGGALLASAAIFGGASLWLPGATLLLGGVVGLLSPKPATPNSSSEEDSSFLFPQGARSSEDGDPIQLPYGRSWVTGKVISAGVDTSDI